MNRIIKKNFWVTQAEADDIHAKAAAACMTEAEFIRQLIAGYTPMPKPDERFFQVMDLIAEMANRIDAVAMKADNSVDMIAVMTEARKWRMVQNALEKEYLRPKRGDG